jgi:hypothetical protein
LVDVPNPPTLAAELYTGLRLSPQRLRFMAFFTALVCIVSVGLASTTPKTYEATVVVDVAAFAVSGTAAFELQSLTDEFLTALASPSTVRATAEELGITEGEVNGGIVVRRDQNATRATIAYTDTDVARAEEVATVAARNALRDLAEQRVAAAQRDVDAATARRDAATAALEAFEDEHGQQGIPGEVARLTELIDSLTSQLASGGAESIQAVLDESSARRTELEPFVREAESYEVERSSAQDQLLGASTRLSQARSQLAAADEEIVVRPGFATEGSRRSGMVTAFATGLVLGVLGSYAITWLLLRRTEGRRTHRAG